MPRIAKRTAKCVCCGSDIEAKRRSKKYCSDKCRQRYNRRKNSPKVKCIGYLSSICPDNAKTTSTHKRCPECKKKHSRFKGFPYTVVGRDVLRIVRQAETIETFPDLESIKSYAEHCKRRASYNSIDMGESLKEYAICHRVPLKHATVVGLTTDSNLFIGLQRLNREAGNLDYGASMLNPNSYIEKSALQENFKIDKKTKTPEIMELLLQYLGGDFLEYIVTENLPVRDTRKEIDVDFCKDGEPPSKVLADQLMFIVGAKNKQLAQNLIDWANHKIYDPNYPADDTYTLIKGSNDSTRWERIQGWLQNNIEFDIDPFIFDYQPVRYDEDDDEW